jgi:hypothetical protein
MRTWGQTYSARCVSILCNLWETWTTFAPAVTEWHTHTQITRQYWEFEWRKLRTWNANNKLYSGTIDHVVKSGWRFCGNCFGYLLRFLRAWRSGDRIPVGARFSAPVQTGPGAQPASCTMGTGPFPGVESGRGVTMIPHPLLVTSSKKGVEL